MAFESLSERYDFQIPDFPEQWLPLVYLYDPDLPLFPLHYFHLLDPQLPPAHRPGERDRVFGFIHHINFHQGVLTASVALNKDLTLAQNVRFRTLVEGAVRQRLGLANQIRLADISGSLGGLLAHANNLVEELWYKVVDRSFGKSLPFGRVWDGVFGLVRFIASWNSEGGRKGELIQTHFFASEFGVRIATGGGIHVDFYLLPTFEEFTSGTNPLNLFPKFADLMQGAEDFVAKYCNTKTLAGAQFSAFVMTKTGVGSKLKTETILAIINQFHGRQREALFDNYSAFNRGPQRSVIALMMFHDIRRQKWSPATLSPTQCAVMYEGLSGTYQTPKVIQLYAQQCFGSSCALPIDNWVETFLAWPLMFRHKTNYYTELFATTDRWGKIERLIWLASQARKVHSSVCADILWCVRFGGPNKEMRGANPLACKICEDHIRGVCPAYASIQNAQVVFNSPRPADAFAIRTTGNNNTTPGQAISECRGPDIFDQYSARDRPNQFAPYPSAGHGGTPMTVKAFLQTY